MRCSLMSSALVVGMFALAAQANVVPISGSVSDSTEQTGATFAGTLDYTYNGGSSGTLIVTLTNTTPASVGGFLTGFVFNIDSSDATRSAVLSSATNANFLDTGTESAPPFGSFDAGAALGADWAGGGSPNPGMAVGDTEMFTFAITASDANVLTAINFMSGPNTWNFVVRFKGLTDLDPFDGVDLTSDKVPAVPAPGAVAMLGAAGILSARRRR